jgi:serine/threonine-protein kinase RsbW
MSGPHNVMEMIIPSDFKFLGAVDAAVQDLAREFACAQRWIDDFSTALVEACTNAIEHGNKYATEKKVRIIVELDDRKIVSRVHDEGEGFDFDKFVSEAPPPDPFSERGRGIMIMKAFTDELNYAFDDKYGLCVELTKTCQGAEPDCPEESE